MAGLWRNRLETGNLRKVYALPEIASIPVREMESSNADKTVSSG
jgi:hypothetical protein